jgi:hypothetical protein
MPMSMSMPHYGSQGGPSAGTATSTPVTTPTPTTAPQVTPSGTAATIDSVATSPSPSVAPQVAPTGTVAPVTFAPSPTPDLGLPTTTTLTPTGGIDQGLSSAEQAENSGGTSGPDTRQTILFVVAGFAAVAVGAALMARKFSASSGTSITNGSVASVPSQEPAADGHLVDEEL